MAKASQGASEKNEEDVAFEKAQPIRNHGLFSKAEKALTIAGWSERARRDIEIFPLEDVEGLTPILMVLADDGSLATAEAEAAAAKGKSWWPFGGAAKRLRSLATAPQVDGERGAGDRQDVEQYRHGNPKDPADEVAHERSGDADQAVGDLTARRCKLLTQPRAAVVKHRLADSRADDHQNYEVAEHVRSPVRLRTRRITLRILADAARKRARFLDREPHARW